MSSFLLLVEDDPTSCAFLRAALCALPAVVDCADTAARAIDCARARCYDLWLIDAHLPDASGAQLLTRLRSMGAGAPALAHTAAHDPALLESLRAQGFDDVICKPVSADALRVIVRSHLAGDARGRAASPLPVGGPAPAAVWDDVAALAALGGDATNVAALRGLFVAELPKQSEEVIRAAVAGDLAAMAAQLHRLRASCAFTGAARLAKATIALAGALDDRDALARFQTAVAVTLAEPGPVPIPW